MIGTIYILSDGPTFFPLLRADLLRHQPALNVVHLASGAELAAIDRRDLAGARLIAFSTATIVPVGVLDALGFGAYNFHPGPPDLPGWRPVSFAVYEGATRYGVTAHAMVADVDAGEIVGTVSFDVPPGIGEMGLNKHMVLALLRLFNLLAPALATSLRPLPRIPVRWGTRRHTRQEARALCDIAPGLAAGEIERLIRAFGAGPVEDRPRIHLHGHAFVVEVDRREEAMAMPNDMVMIPMIGR